jgi:hypothetical protein
MRKMKKNINEFAQSLFDKIGNRPTLKKYTGNNTENHGEW